MNKKEIEKMGIKKWEDEAIYSAELAGADMDAENKFDSMLVKMITTLPEYDINLIKQFIDQQKKEIGKEFKKWILKGTEDAEDAIFRITGVKI